MWNTESCRYVLDRMLRAILLLGRIRMIQLPFRTSIEYSRSKCHIVLLNIPRDTCLLPS